MAENKAASAWADAVDYAKKIRIYPGIKVPEDLNEQVHAELVKLADAEGLELSSNGDEGEVFWPKSACIDSNGSTGRLACLIYNINGKAWEYQAFDHTFALIEEGAEFDRNGECYYVVENGIWKKKEWNFESEYFDVGVKITGKIRIRKDEIVSDLGFHLDEGMMLPLGKGFELDEMDIEWVMDDKKRVIPGNKYEMYKGANPNETSD